MNRDTGFVLLLVMLLGSCVFAAEDTVAMRVARRKLPQPGAVILPQSGWVPQRQKKHKRKIWIKKTPYVYVMSTVSQACADDVGAHIEVFAAQVVPVLEEMFGQQSGGQTPVRLYVYPEKEHAPGWWNYIDKGYQVWHDASKNEVHWVLESGAGKERLIGAQLPRVQHETLHVLLRRFLKDKLFFRDDYLTESTPREMHDNYDWRKQESYEKQKEARRLVPSARLDDSQWIDALDQWREEEQLYRTQGVGDPSSLKERARRILTGFTPLRRAMQGFDWRKGVSDELKSTLSQPTTPAAFYKKWDSEYDSWRGAVSNWGEMATNDRDSLIIKLLTLLGVWEARQPIILRDKKPKKRTVPPSFEEGCAVLLGTAWNIYQKPVANLSFAQVAYNPLLLVQGPNPTSDPFVETDYHGESVEKDDPRAPWLNAKTLIDQALFHRRYKLNTSAQGFLLISFFVNDQVGGDYLEQMVRDMRYGGGFYRYAQMDTDWVSYLEKGVLRTCGGNGLDLTEFHARYSTLPAAQPAVATADIKAGEAAEAVAPHWPMRQGYPEVEGLWRCGAFVVRLKQYRHRVGIHTFNTDGRLLFKGRGAFAKDGTFNGEIRDPKTSRYQAFKAELAPSGEMMRMLEGNDYFTQGWSLMKRD